MRWIVVGAVVVVVVVVLALLVAGVIPGLKSNGSGPGSGLSAEQAAAASGTSLAQGIPGGPWSAVIVEGALLTQSGSVTASQLIPGNASCRFQNASETGFSYSGWTGAYDTGLAAAWLFFYVSTSATPDALLVVVQNGVATSLGTLGGPGCSFSGGAISLPKTGLVDSTAAAHSADATTAGAAFTAAVSVANVTFTLENTQGGPLWTVRYAGCAGTTNEMFMATVGAENGTVLQSVTDTSSGGCGSTGTPLGSAFAAGNPVLSMCPSNETYSGNGCAAGDFTYTLTIESSTVAFGDVLFEVKTPTGTTLQISSPGGFSILSVAGVVTAQTTPSPSLAMTQPWAVYNNGASSSTPLTTLYTIVIDVGTLNPAGMGYTFTALGTGSYSGSTGPVSLP